MRLCKEKSESNKYLENYDVLTFNLSWVAENGEHFTIKIVFYPMTFFRVCRCRSCSETQVKITNNLFLQENKRIWLTRETCLSDHRRGPKQRYFIGHLKIINSRSTGRCYIDCCSQTINYMLYNLLSLKSLNTSCRYLDKGHQIQK